MLKKIIMEKMGELADTVRILLYQKAPDLLTEIDLNKDLIFLEPLVLAYLNQGEIKIDILSELLIYYRKTNEINLPLELYNNQDLAYLPNIGYFQKGERTPFHKPEFIDFSNIEVFLCEIPLLRNVIHLMSIKKPINNVDLLMDRSLFEGNIDYLKEAFNYYQNYHKKYFDLISIPLKKCVFFKIKGKIGRSFSSIKANGTIFFNVFQDESHKQDEIYFIDNLGTCTGGMFFSTIFHNFRDVFKVPYNTKTSDIIITNETRNIYTLFLNFFVESNGAYCLKGILEEAPLQDKQRKEMELRLILHLKKAKSDKKTIEKLITHYSKKNLFFNKNAEIVYDFAVSNYNDVYKLFEDRLLELNNLNVNHRMKFYDFKDVYLGFVK